MKNYFKYLLAILSISLITSLLNAEQYYYFNGYVGNVSDSLPLSGELVFINYNMGMQIATMTDENGYYSDSLRMDTIELDFAEVGIFDCEGNYISQSFTPPQAINTADFYICPSTSGCQAYFEYYVNENYNEYSFINLSEGSYTSLMWDFGDGTYSNEENPLKVYTDDGIYSVSLFIDDSTGNCQSSFSQLVYVFEDDTSSCFADFTYFQTVENMNEIQFLDMSSLNISSWHWDFGDSTDSYEQNPMHVYSEEGSYLVSLMVSSNLSECRDTITKTIIVGDSSTCYADFTYSLDTLNNTPNTYYFTNTSSEGMGQYFWDFGDGNISMDENPVHTYENSGEYMVCLTAVGSQPVNQCTDVECKILSTPSYFNFGGHLFIDGFTINVDENDSSNIATAYLYRRLDNQWKYMDKRNFWKYGYYWFVQKPEGEYLIRFELEPESADYNSYAPSYYGNKSDWRNASSFNLENETQFEVNASMKKLNDINAGTGVIGGTLTSDESCDLDIDLSNQIIKLFKDDKYVLFTKTNGNGDYEFTSLPEGNYKLQAEISGMISSVENVQLTTSLVYSDNNNLLIKCDAYVGMEEITDFPGSILLENVYPIPAKNNVTFRILSSISTDVNIVVRDILGKKISTYKVSLAQTESDYMINIENTKASILLFEIRSSDGKIISKGKIVRNIY